MMRLEDCIAVAREHVAWARQAGFEPDEVVASVGVRPIEGCSWDEAVGVLMAKAQEVAS